jgi:hypothetical protein
MALAEEGWLAICCIDAERITHTDEVGSDVK